MPFSPYLLIIRSISRHMLPLPVHKQLPRALPLPTRLTFSLNELNASKFMNCALVSFSLYHYYRLNHKHNQKHFQQFFADFVCPLKSNQKERKGVKKERWWWWWQVSRWAFDKVKQVNNNLSHVSSAWYLPHNFWRWLICEKLKRDRDRAKKEIAWAWRGQHTVCVGGQERDRRELRLPLINMKFVEVLCW